MLNGRGWEIKGIIKTIKIKLKVNKISNRGYIEETNFRINNYGLQNHRFD